MQFEYDWEKSEANKAKHGIDFEEAQALWDDNTVCARLRYKAEPRYAYVGTINGKCWTAIITYRGFNVQIISVRRSRKDEERIYHERIQ